MSKVVHAPVRKGECYVVLMRRMKPGEHHGKWEPITTNGYVVVCHGKLEAAELTWFMGVRFFARPLVAGEDPMDDMQYLDWLWAHHLKVQRWESRGDGVTPGDAGELTYGQFIHGWHPDAADIERLVTSPSAQMTQVALHSRWRDI